MAARADSVKVSNIKEKLLRPALTSHYICSFDIPGGSNGFIGRRVSLTSDSNNLLSLSCFDASLPGSTLATHDINNDFTGVSEKHVYRRLYDDRADFSFYVDAEQYYVIKVFEGWMGLTVNEQYGSNNEKITQRSYNYRVNYPNTYCVDNITITKFERSNPSPELKYTFVKAFPVSINSMQVSYDSSELLKCTVSFAYSRYWIDGLQVPRTPSTTSSNTPRTNEPSQSTPPGIPTPSTSNNFNLTPQQQAAFNSQSFNFNQAPNTFNESPATAFNVQPGTRQNPRSWDTSNLSRTTFPLF
jgi:hypothetical protein